MNGTTITENIPVEALAMFGDWVVVIFGVGLLLAVVGAVYFWFWGTNDMEGRK